VSTAKNENMCEECCVFVFSFEICRCASSVRRFLPMPVAKIFAQGHHRNVVMKFKEFSLNFIK